MDGRYFGAAVAGAVPPALAEAPLYLLYERGLDSLGGVRFFARRLRDDENAWFTGEIEVLSTTVDAARIESAVRQVAESRGTTVRTLDTPFTPKLLKQDRLEVTT